MSELGAQPDYDGIAVGDLLLRDFSPFKNRLFYGKVNVSTLDTLMQAASYGRTTMQR